MRTIIHLQLIRYSPHEVVNYDFDIETKQIHIGANSDNDIVINLDSVSGNHGILFRRGGMIHYQDTSTNGTEWITKNGAHVFGTVHNTTVGPIMKGDELVFKKLIDGVKKRVYRIKVLGFGE